MNKENRVTTKDIISGITAYTLIQSALIYAVILGSKSQDFLTDAKLSAKNSAPALEQQCDLDDPLDMGCYRNVTEEVCDGQNTMFNTEDDVCETVTYWKYRPVVNIYR